MFEKVPLATGWREDWRSQDRRQEEQLEGGIDPKREIMRPNAGSGAGGAEKGMDSRVVFHRQSWQAWEPTDEGSREGEPRTSQCFKNIYI